MHSSSPSPPSLRRFTPEFRLILQCLRWPYDDAALDGIAEAAALVTDWNRVVAITRRHRIAGLVRRGILAVELKLPEEFTTTIQRLASEQAKLGILLSMETERLGKAFASSGIEPVFLKGAPLTQAIFGDLALRHSKDIDLLVSPGEVRHAVEVLRQAGYRPLEPLSADPEHLETWKRYGKSMDWSLDQCGIMLELHWRLTDLPLLRGARPELSLQRVRVGFGTEVSTLSGDLLLAYLCVHGAAHGWGRLKWLADVYALAPHGDPAAIEALYRRTRQQDAGRAVAQALLLCHDLFGLEIGRVEWAAQDDIVLSLLRASVLRLLARGGETAEVDHQRFGSTWVYLSRFFLGSGDDALRSEIRTWTYRPGDVAQSTLPRPLFFLFPLVRLGQWVSTRLRHGGRSHPGA